jgi:hypothetical protein
MILKFNLKKPCADCPFNKVGAIKLQEGRVEGIIDTLRSDHNFFQCHKTVHSENGGDWVENEHGESCYIASGNESVCMGSLIYALKAKMGIPVVARLAFSRGDLNYEAMIAQFDNIIDVKERL